MSHKCLCERLHRPVVSVLDDNTIEVLHNTHSERVRLSGIDCPEKGQGFGNRTKQVASGSAFGKEVTIQTHGYDKYKRILGDVILPDGVNLNQELVKQGWCWWYRKYAPGDTVLEGLENEAREAKRGLWDDPSPIPPWAYRKARRDQSLDLSDLVPVDAETRGVAASRGPALLGAREQDSAVSSSPYPIIGNQQRHSYHQPDCPNYSQIAPHNRVAFNSAAAAEAAGYWKAVNCP